MTIDPKSFDRGIPEVWGRLGYHIAIKAGEHRIRRVASKVKWDIQQGGLWHSVSQWALEGMGLSDEKYGDYVHQVSLNRIEKCDPADQWLMWFSASEDPEILLETPPDERCLDTDPMARAVSRFVIRMAEESGLRNHDEW